MMRAVPFLPGMVEAPYEVLLVEDDRALRSLMRILLEETGRVKVIAEAEDGREALALAARLHPEWILLDLTMPGMDGRTALPLLQQQVPLSRILCVSMLQSDGIEDEAKRLGAYAFLDKGQDSCEFVQNVLRTFTNGSMRSVSAGAA